ncbi:lysyl-tRNA synthetase [Xylariaceae sp. FL0662B]|nr:lysyl-tRNA synthetase [Xylariaceae sp. FL0662B]
MNHGQCLKFLRPYLCEAPPTRTAAYARFFSAAHGDAVLAERTRDSRPCRSIRISAPREAAKDGETPSSSRAVTVKGRVQKLTDYDALRYPRLGSRPNRMSIPEFRSKYRDIASVPAEEKVLLEGRVMSVRRFGSKLVFLSVMGAYEQVQIMISLGQLSEPRPSPQEFKKALHPFLRGDIVSVTGRAVRTGRDELTLSATELPTLLSPGLAPLPDKLINEETRVLNRHIDFLVNRHVSDAFRLRSHIIKFMRDFFHERDFLEVQTPILADHAGGAIARPFLTSATEFPQRDLALRIAPELWLKRLVVGGNDKIFEIGPAFRNEGLDTTHNPEFTMCEFYSAYSTLPELIWFTQNLITSIFQSVDKIIQDKLKSLQKPLQNPRIELSEGAWKQVEFIPALEEILGFQFPDLAEPDALPKLLKLLDGRTDFTPSPEAVLNKLLDDLAGAYLEADSHKQPLFVVHHPACMSPLSKSFTCPKTGQLVSARAELFIQGREMANMYEEENDPFEQRRKFELQAEAHNRRAVTTGEPLAEVDESYIHALELGLPPTGGWGCGVDRLVMLLSGAPRIGDTLPFGNLKNIVSLRQAAKDASSLSVYKNPAADV